MHQTHLVLSSSPSARRSSVRPRSTPPAEVAAHVRTLKVRHQPRDRHHGGLRPQMLTRFRPSSFSRDSSSEPLDPQRCCVLPGLPRQRRLLGTARPLAAILGARSSAPARVRRAVRRLRRRRRPKGPGGRLRAPGPVDVELRREFLRRCRKAIPGRTCLRVGSTTSLPPTRYGSSGLDPAGPRIAPLSVGPVAVLRCGIRQPCVEPQVGDLREQLRRPGTTENCLEACAGRSSALYVKKVLSSPHDIIV